MDRKELVTIKMSINEALNILQVQMGKTCVPAGYGFGSWANNIPRNLLSDKEMIQMTFVKTNNPST